MRVAPLDVGTLAHLHPAARRSVFWELDPLTCDPSLASDMDKYAWLLAQAYEHTTVGFSIVDERAETGAHATILMCPPAAVPGAVRLPTAPFSADAYALTSLHLDSSASGIGWEAVLIDATVVHLTQSSVPAVEAFGLKPDHPEELTGICKDIVEDAREIGLMPLPVLESAGFTIISDHHVIPRLRLDLPPSNGLLSESEIAELLAAVPATS